jgi:hypothetical protein
MILYELFKFGGICTLGGPDAGAISGDLAVWIWIDKNSTQSLTDNLPYKRGIA